MHYIIVPSLNAKYTYCHLLINKRCINWQKSLDIFIDQLYLYVFIYNLILFILLYLLSMVYQTAYHWYFFNLMKYVSFEILWKFCNFLKSWNFITPLPIIINIYWTPSLPMVFWPPYPWYIDPPTHGILTPLPMVYQTLSFGRNEGGSKYNDKKLTPYGKYHR
jgi:hypothetical protein